MTTAAARSRPAMLPFAFLALVAACSESPVSQDPQSAQPQEAAGPSAPAPKAGANPTRPAVYSYKVLARYPHGTTDFTQGLFFKDGVLYESTGRPGQSQLIRHGLFGEAEEMRKDLPRTVFGEGAVAVGEEIVSLTYRAGIGYVHGLSDFTQRETFPVRGEGWGLTFDGDRLIMSDGSNRLKFLDPQTYEVTDTLAVTANGRPVPQLNELEFIKGEIWANVWQTDVIVRIDPGTGNVTGFIDLSGLNPNPADPVDDVLNGIAYDPETERLLVTGKNWPHLFEIELVPAGSAG